MLNCPYNNNNFIDWIILNDLFYAELQNLQKSSILPIKKP